MKREELTAALRPLVSRMHTGHCWRKGPSGPRRIDEPLDEVKLSEHVMGGAGYGLCPIVPGESTTRVACLDFDSHKGEIAFDLMRSFADDVALSLEIDGYKPVLFRSSGGHGIHLYLVWDEPQDAFSVRELLRAALGTCGLTSGTGGVAKAEVEIFPKQDAVPLDGFGNMFVLPFSGKSERLAGEFEPCPSVPFKERPPKPERSITDTPPELSVLKSALDAIPNSGEKELSYDEWRDVVFAVHHATDGSDVGLSLAHEFSARSSKYDPDFLDTRVWPYARSDRDGAVITERSLYARASSEHGWQDPTIADDFEVVPNSDEAARSGGDASERARFTFIPEAQFATGSPPEWRIQEVIPEADLVVVYGESGSGKSFFTLDLAQAIARGEPWRGKRVKQGRVAYIAAEGAGGFRNRVNAYKREHKLDTTDLFVLADSPSFLHAPHVHAVIASLKAIGPVAVVIVDTLAQVTPGGAENSSEDMGKVISHCRAIRKQTGALVVLIHHAGKDASKGARGWSGLRAAADAEIEIVRAEHDRVATITKQKDGEDGAEFGFKLRTVPIGVNEAGDVISSCVLEHGAAVAKDKRRAGPKGEIEKAVWQVVMDLQGLDGAAPTTDAVLTEYANRTPHDPALGKRDTRRQHALRALTTLSSRGSIVVEGDFVKLPGGE